MITIGPGGSAGDEIGPPDEIGAPGKICRVYDTAQCDEHDPANDAAGSMRSTDPMKSTTAKGRRRPTGPGPLMKSMRSQQQQGMLLDLFDEIMGPEVRRRARSSSPDSRDESRGFPRREGGSVTSRPAHEKSKHQLSTQETQAANGGICRSLAPGGPRRGRAEPVYPPRSIQRQIFFHLFG